MVLEALLGNKSIERILLFLLVNESCYATQVQKMLHIALTPIQKALQRLENGGILSSTLLGKVRIYQFNQNYPFLLQLESLLREAYLHLPMNEKKLYSITGHQLRENHQLVHKVWQKLKEVKKVEFFATSLPKRIIVGNGSGNVEVQSDKNTLIFSEKGQVDAGDIFNFKNVFRWTYHQYEGMISLEHLRHGKNNPVFLFHLMPKGVNFLESVHAHLCGKDTYLGLLRLHPEKLTLLWRIMGPKKNEEIQYNYL